MTSIKSKQGRDEIRRKVEIAESVRKSGKPWRATDNETILALLDCVEELETSRDKWKSEAFKLLQARENDIAKLEKVVIKPLHRIGDAHK